MMQLRLERCTTVKVSILLLQMFILKGKKNNNQSKLYLGVTSGSTCLKSGITVMIEMLFFFYQ